MVLELVQYLMFSIYMKPSFLYSWKQNNSEITFGYLKITKYTLRLFILIIHGEVESTPIISKYMSGVVHRKCLLLLK